MSWIVLAVVVAIGFVAIWWSNGRLRPVDTRGRGTAPRAVRAEARRVDLTGRRGA
jgi:hypothetical protein